MPTTESQKRAAAKYRRTAKGIAARKRAQDRYNRSTKGRQTRRRYLAGTKGRMSVAAYKRAKAIMAVPAVTNK